MTKTTIIIDVRGTERVVRLFAGMEAVRDRIKSGDIDAYHASEAIDELIAEFIDDGEQQDIKGESQGD